MHGSQVRRFGTSLRNSLGTKSVTPGPGMYKLPSEFGHYIAKSFIKEGITPSHSTEK